MKTYQGAPVVDSGTVVSFSPRGAGGAGQAKIGYGIQFLVWLIDLAQGLSPCKTDIGGAQNYKIHASDDKINYI